MTARILVALAGMTLLPLLFYAVTLIGGTK